MRIIVKLIAFIILSVIATTACTTQIADPTSDSQQLAPPTEAPVSVDEATANTKRPRFVNSFATW